MNGCLPHSNSENSPKNIVYLDVDAMNDPNLEYPWYGDPTFPQKNEVPQKFPKKILVFYRWLTNLLDLSQNIKLSEEEWARSYELHTIRRESGNPVSTRRVPY